MYCVGDRVVHPMHGAGIVQGVKTIERGGCQRDYYVVCFKVGNMISEIPIDGCDKIGIRDIITKDEARKVLEYFHTCVIDHRTNWNKRQRENITKLKSGDIYQAAGVLKELMCRDKKRGLSTSERKTLSSARQIVISELALSGVADENDIELIFDETVSETLESLA